MLAGAEEAGGGGADLFTAFVVGYEIGARIAEAANLRPEVHPHGTAVAVAACAGLAKLWGYTAPELAAAVQQGAGLTVPADWNAARVGATVRNLFTAVSLQNAFIATASIRCGLGHNPGALDQVFGRILGTAFDASALASALGTRWCIGEGVCFKRHACCRGAHGALGALFELRRAAEFDPEAVTSVTVRAYRSAALLNDTAPRTPLGAKFSIPHALAAAVVLGDSGVDAFGADSLCDERIRALARRVRVVEDPTFTARLP